MYYQDLNEITKRPEIVVSLAGFLNPATIVPALALGAVAVTGIVAWKAMQKVKSENTQLLEDKQTLQTQIEHLSYEDESVSESDHEPYSEPLDLTVGNGCANGSNTVQYTAQNISDEELRKEMIRQTMSELGKRSAEARRRKKLDYQNG